jgi:hypothetical protein
MCIHEPISVAERIANARLIHAAPELLANLRLLVRGLKRTGSSLSLADAEMAIKHATKRVVLK